MSDNLVPYTVTDLTEGTLNGEGVLDTLLRSVNVHLQEEYSKSRIRGVEWSQVYLGSLTAVMAQATQFLLTKDQSYYQAQLLKAQVDLAELEKAKVAIETQVLEKQLIKADVEIKVLNAQEALLEQQLETERAQTEDLDTGNLGKAQTKITSDISLANKEGAKVDQEIALGKQTALNAVIQGKVYTEQVTKTANESALLAQKKLTEVAQVVGTLSYNGDGSINSTVGGVIGEQMRIYRRQSDGYARDAEQKAADIAVRAFAVIANASDLSVTNIPNSLEPVQADKVFVKLNSGIGVNTQT